MKNFKIVFVMALMCLFTSSVKAQSIGDILKGVVGSVVSGKMTSESSIKGTWKYSAPACEFESSSVLAQAGGSAVATKMENKVAPILKKMGVNGIVYTFDKKNKTITFTPNYGKAYTAYVATQGSTMTLTLNSDKLMTILKTISNSTAGLSTSASVINSIIKNYDGMRLGFELKK